MGYNFFEGCEGIPDSLKHKQAPMVDAIEDEQDEQSSQEERRPIDKKVDQCEGHAFFLPSDRELSTYEEYIGKSRPVDDAIINMADTVFPSVITIDMLVQALPYTPGYIAQRVYMLVRQGRLCRCDRHSYKGRKDNEHQTRAMSEDALYRIGCDIYSLLSHHHPLRLEAIRGVVPTDVAIDAIRVFKERARNRKGHPRPIQGNSFDGYLLGSHVSDTAPDPHDIFRVLSHTHPMTANEIAVLLMCRSGNVLKVLNRYKNRPRGVSFTCTEDDTQHIIWSVSNGSLESHESHF